LFLITHKLTQSLTHSFTHAHTHTLSIFPFSAYAFIHTLTQLVHVRNRYCVCYYNVRSWTPADQISGWLSLRMSS